MDVGGAVSDYKYLPESEFLTNQEEYSRGSFPT